MKPSRIKITHIITDLSMGGAEMMLYKLLCGMDPELFESQVISLTEDGPIGERIRGSGIPIKILGLRPNFPNPLLILQLLRWLKEFPQDIVQSWMYHADLIGGLTANFIKPTSVVWGIRNSTLDPKLSKRSTILTMKACARLSHSIPTRIVSCSDAVKHLHVSKGYAADKIIVIPNGFDLEEFHPDPVSRKKVRSEIGIPDDVFLIGHVGRFDPQKDYPTLIAAAKLLHQRYPDVHFLLCGDRITWENTELAEMVDASGLRMVFHLIGMRSDMPQ
ncbi:MAG: glycosyltransferase, partial [Anaerolineaceae bacterium]|nr:glycosyltransferase [Anaerolineaceae bacterium]